MSGRGNHKKAKIHMEKPELPAFLQRMKEQIVAYEDTERRERSDIRRRACPERPDDPEDEPIIVRLGEDDLTEEEYKKMKTELESQYKFDDTTKRDERKTHVSQELDIDLIINSRQVGPESSTSRGPSQSRTHRESEVNKAPANKNVHGTRKVLSYGSSSEDEDND